MSNKDWIFGDKEVARRFRALPDGIRSNVTDSIGRLTLRLRKKIVVEKLSGRELVNGRAGAKNKSLQVLNVRTGTLRRSVHDRLLTDNQAIAGVVSTNVKYGKAHEYGGVQTETVREHLRLVKEAFGKTLRSPVFATVKAHSRTVDLPERSFLRSSLAEMKDEIVSDVEKAVTNGVSRK